MEGSVAGIATSCGSASPARASNREQRGPARWPGTRRAGCARAPTPMPAPEAAAPEDNDQDFIFAGLVGTGGGGLDGS